MSISVRGLIVLLLALCVGCEDAVVEKPKKTTKTTKKSSKEKTKVAEASKVKVKPRPGATIRSTGGSGGSNLEYYQASTGQTFGGGGNSSSNFNSSPAQSESQTIEVVGTSIRESLELGPTLVVWMFDRSESSTSLVTSSQAAIRSLYATDDIKAAAKDGKLLTAVVGFGEKTDFLAETPASEAAQVNAALDALKVESGSKEETFAALKLTLEKYLPLRTKEMREVVVAMVTDEPGDDPKVLDEALALAQKNAIPVYVVGPGSPLGRTVATEAGGGSDTRTPAADVFSADWVSFNTGGGMAESFESPLGPWALERLCRESGGKYLSVGGWAGSGNGERVDPKVMERYAPEYLTLAAMEKSLKENKCRAALLAASQLPPTKSVLMSPQTVFAKSNNEAQMKTMLDKAQLPAALLQGDLDKLYDTLAAGEADRAKVKDLRTQIAFDTALGRAAAAKVRVDGYNSMLAALKQGKKTFENPGSTTWYLEPADTIETGSSLQKMIDKAKALLEAVQKDHPNTPWARLAEQELRTPLGWKWREQ